MTSRILWYQTLLEMRISTVESCTQGQCIIYLCFSSLLLPLKKSSNSKVWWKNWHRAPLVVLGKDSSTVIKATGRLMTGWDLSDDPEYLSRDYRLSPFFSHLSIVFFVSVSATWCWHLGSSIFVYERLLKIMLGYKVWCNYTSAAVLLWYALPSVKFHGRDFGYRTLSTSSELAIEQL